MFQTHLQYLFCVSGYTISNLCGNSHNTKATLNSHTDGQQRTDVQYCQQSQQQWRDVITRGLITRKRSGAMRADSPGVMDNGPDHPELSGDHWRDWPTDYHFNSAGICHFQLKCSGFVGRQRGGGERPICCMAVRASVLLLFGGWDVGGWGGR